MRHPLLLLLILLIVGCESTPTSTNIIEDIPTNTSITFDNASAFNDYISIRVNTVHELLEQLQLADDNDASASELIQQSEDAKATTEKILQELNGLTAFGKDGEALLQLTVSYIESKINVINIYAEFAAQLSIPESDWTNEDFDAWMSNAEPYFGVSDQIMQELMDMQQTYLSNN
jgi:hypothetical protein